MPNPMPADASVQPTLGNTAWVCLRLAVWRGSYVLVVAFVAAVLAVSAVFLALKFIDPPGSAVMLWHRLAGQEVKQSWVPIARISPHLIRAVVVSEDARFCRHRGIDMIEFERALAQARRSRNLDVRGASTISMQVVKNLLLWQDKALVRKGLEVAITPLMELILSKRRILEIYLNIAEWGPGIFGAEAAARHHFRRPAAKVSRGQAALLAVALPNPARRRAGRPGPLTQRNAQRIRARAGNQLRAISCLGPLGSGR